MNQKPTFIKLSPIYEMFIQFPFRDAVASNLFYASRKYIREATVGLLL